MQLKVKQRYYDKKEEVYIEKDSVIERDESRAKQLIAAGVARELPRADSSEQKQKDETVEKTKSSRRKKTE